MSLCVRSLQVYLGWLCGAHVVHHSRHHTGCRPHTRTQPRHEGVLLLLYPCWCVDKLHSEAREEQLRSNGQLGASALVGRKLLGLCSAKLKLRKEAKNSDGGCAWLSLSGLQLSLPLLAQAPT